ncbi:hypothetical protein L596_003200 [Steinernema carpocapsae]|uniref:Uncharacterized protein n=1 Tax=Steinernema carpocapsae TaxID=34508 RepID=A0A4U8URF9_STECR|nr:hypothetical protein L596_003200 [Steinernema carpocapsae]
MIILKPDVSRVGDHLRSQTVFRRIPTSVSLPIQGTPAITCAPAITCTLEASLGNYLWHRHQHREDPIIPGTN